MQIDKKDFCYLISSQPFLNWLKDNALELYKDLFAYLQTSPPCKANKVKMEWILRTLMQDRSVVKKLGRFIKDNYPTMIVGSMAHNEAQVKAQQSAVQAATMDENVFAGLDISPTSIPRRRIITVFDAVRQHKDLNSAAREFCSRFPHCDYVITAGSAAYIEFLPLEIQHLAQTISVDAWVVRRYKARLDN